MRPALSELRMYFVLAGLLDTSIRAEWLPASVAGASAVADIGFVIGCALVYMGIRLPVVLRTAPRQVTAVLCAGAGLLIVALLLGLAGPGPHSAIGWTLPGLAATWFLFVNARRLSASASAVSLTT